MSNVAVQIHSLSKRFRLHRQRSSTMHDAFADIVGVPGRMLQARLRGADGASAGRWLWALRDISCEIERGEIVGLIGRNGAGKSTLLKILSRIVEPTSGHALVYGRVGSLLEVGTGFHPELNGRDNVYLSGITLGMKKAEIDRRFDEIVAFSEVEKFLDTPVKHYSSGMRVRLAFAVAAHLQADIMIIDEVLAVGDTQFQKKCLDTMKEVVKSGRTVLFVSHNLAAVRHLCSRALLLQGGSVAYDGTVDGCLGRYAEENCHYSTRWHVDPGTLHGALRFTRISMRLEGDQPHHVLRVQFELATLAPHRAAYIALAILDAGGTVLMRSLPTAEGFLTDATREHTVRLAVHLPPLVPNRYLVNAWVGSQAAMAYDEVSEQLSFEIYQSPTRDHFFPHDGDNGWIVPETSYEFA